MISEQRIEEALERLFSTLSFREEPRGLYDPLRYMIELGGKRIRPRLLLLTYSLYKDEFTPAVLDAAAAIEVFHSFTLIHDDIMDKADTRRGKPTVYRKWNADTAILSGDVMSIESFRLLSSAPVGCLPELMSLFTRTAAQVCEGQQLDMDFETLRSVPMRDYLEMIGLKTAVLLACAARMGALIAGAPQAACEALYQYGYELGLAFQIADDYLDTFGDSAVFGKTLGGDILNGKKTWLLTEAFARAADKGSPVSVEELDAAVRSRCTTPQEEQAKIERVKALYCSLGVDRLAREAIRNYHARAMAQVDQMNPGSLRVRLLQRYADRLASRNK